MPIDNKSGLDQGLNETALNVLKSLFPEAKNVTIKMIQERTGYSYEPVYRTLNGLLERGFIKQEKVGKTLVYSIETEKWYARLAYYHYSSLRAFNFLKKFSKIRHVLMEIPRDKVDAIIIFGSYSKGTQHEKSDVDIMIVSDHKDIKRELSHIKNINSLLDIQDIIVPRKEFYKIKSENKELWASLIENGIIIEGVDLMYNQAYQNGK